MGCMALNVGLHLRYGKELFLYTPNWTYVLISFGGHCMAEIIELQMVSSSAADIFASAGLE